MKDMTNVTKGRRILLALSGLVLLAAFLSGNSCATTALSTKNTGGPVKVFELGQRIPRNSKILDTMDAWHYWAGICRYITIIRHLQRSAKALGGDAIGVLYVREPIIRRSCFMIKAFLLDMIDISDWPRVGLTEEEIRHDLDGRGRVLDDIEGIWASRALSEVIMDEAAERVAGVPEFSQNDGASKGTFVWGVPASVIQAMRQLSPEEQRSYRVAIVKAAGDPDYPYAAYILDPETPEWQAGFLKARLKKLPDSSGYEASWYGTTFQAGLREFQPDETGALKTSVVVEFGLKYSIEQTLTRVYPPTAANNAPD